MTIDGSRVLAHMPPEDTYNSSAAPRAIAKSERNYADKAATDARTVVATVLTTTVAPTAASITSRGQDSVGLSPW